jgi:hypothetical protein
MFSELARCLSRSALAEAAAALLLLLLLLVLIVDEVMREDSESTLTGKALGACILVGVGAVEDCGPVN